MEYTNHSTLGTVIPTLNRVLIEPSSANCKERATEYQHMLEIKTKARKDIEPLVATLETKLDQYFTDQNGKMIKVNKHFGCVWRGTILLIL